MGFSMCKHLLNAKYDLTVFNRTAAKADGLLKLGAKWAEPL
jgi:3-hydroxyisobutyrate dehydrogenase